MCSFSLTNNLQSNCMYQWCTGTKIFLALEREENIYCKEHINHKTSTRKKIEPRARTKTLKPYYLSLFLCVGISYALHSNCACGGFLREPNPRVFSSKVVCCTQTVPRQIFGHNWPKSLCFQVQPVTCCDLSDFLY